MPEADPVDRAAYAALFETVGGDTEFLGELVGEFVSEAVRLVANMQAAAEAGRAADLARDAHQLKSSSASLGALVLSQLCGDLEAHARECSSPGLVGRVAAIEAEVPRVTDMLRALDTTH